MSAALGVVEQADLVRTGQVSAEELVRDAIARIEALNPAINAVISERFEQALAEARGALPDGPLKGVPTLVKDVLPAAGEPCYRGLGLLRTIRWVENEDSYVSLRLRQAGAIVLGRTNVPQLAAAITTEPQAFGPTRNPWDLTRTVGGSSGGSAAAVAAGMVSVAHGGDGGGSIRIPASMCGLVGLKPSRGLISSGPGFSDTEGLSVHGVLTRDVAGTAIAIDALSGQLPGDPFHAIGAPLRDQPGRYPGVLRIGMWAPGPRFPTSVDAECVTACEEAASLLESLGHKVEPAYPTTLDEGVSPSFFAVATALLAHNVAELVERTGHSIGEADLEPVTWAAVCAGRTVSAVDYQQGIAALREQAHQFADWWTDGYDILLTPTVAVPPFVLGALAPPTNGNAWPDNGWMTPFSSPFNISGLPAISLPLHRTANELPVGVQLGAAFGREDLLLRAAAQLEQAVQWRQYVPQNYAAAA